MTPTILNGDEKTCRVCDHRIVDIPSTAGVFPRGQCSVFCNDTSPQDKIRFLTLRVGEYGVFPCSECGTVMEGDYAGPPSVCSRCSPKLRERVLYDLLARCKVLEMVNFPDLRRDIDEALKMPRP